MFAQVAQFFSPYIVHSSATHPDLPFVALGAGSLVGAAVSMALPETAGVDLPDTVEEAKVFGRGQRVCDMPCLQHRAGRRNNIIKHSEEKTRNTMA